MSKHLTVNNKFKYVHLEIKTEFCIRDLIFLIEKNNLKTLCILTFKIVSCLCFEKLVIRLGGLDLSRHGLDRHSRSRHF